MKFTFYFTLLALFIFSCKTAKFSEFSQGYWAEVTAESVYLYTTSSFESIVHKEIKQGSIIFVDQKIGDFTTVYSGNPKKIKNSDIRNAHKYFVKSGTYKKMYREYSSVYGKLYELPFDSSKNYVSGERGGCYFINGNGNRTYVNRTYCGSSSDSKALSRFKPKTTYKVKNSYTSVQCSGRTKKGSRCKNRTKSSSGRCHLHYNYILEINS